MSVKIKKGNIEIYRVFDVSEEIDLSKAEKLLDNATEGPRLKLPADTRKAIIMKDAPLSIKLGQTTLSLPSGEYPINVFARIWNYGVMSVRLELPMPKDIEWDDIILLAAQLETVPEIDKLSIAHKEALLKKLAPAIIEPTHFDISEDYITYIVEDAEGIENPKEFIGRVDVAGLILAETKEELSQDSKDFIFDAVTQYAATDLALIDWNSALLIEPEGERDVSDVIEFTLTQLLEFRYYDDMLDNNLQELYDSMEHRPGGLKSLFNNFYSEKAEDSSRKYIQFSEFISKVENSLKTVGDGYLAVVFRKAAKQFRFTDWKQGISRKLSTLAEITQMFHGEVNVKRSHWLEIIVIILIAIELVPMIVNLHHFTKPAGKQARDEISAEAYVKPADNSVNPAASLKKSEKKAAAASTAKKQINK